MGLEGCRKTSLQNYTLHCGIFQKSADLKELYDFVVVVVVVVVVVGFWCFFNIYIHLACKNNLQHICVFLACPLGQMQIYLYLVSSIFPSCRGCIYSCYKLECLKV